MAKPMMLIRAPVGTRSGYGDMARDICRHLISLDKWDVLIAPCAWGNTPMNALTEDDPKDKVLIDKFMRSNNLPRQPEIFVSITVPPEFQPIGKFNIGITAGIETTACAPQWIEPMNRMDLILTISEHSKKVLASTQYQVQEQQGGSQRTLKLEKPIEVLHNCVDTSIFKPTVASDLDSSVIEAMEQIDENFCFLFVGHWLSGDVGADRKDVGMLIKVFLETFRRAPKKGRPALILKTSGAGFSVIDRERLIQKINAIKASVNAQNLPNIYLLHGDLSEREMNSLYNHPKIKAHVSFTKGEGFGRPLLEASVAGGKPIIASGWSGHLDFLNKDEAILLGGKLEQVHPSAQWKGMIEENTQWFQVDYNSAANILNYVWRNYKQVKSRGKALGKKNSSRFSIEAITRRTDELMAKYVPEFKVPEQVSLSLPDLPQIKKIEVKKKKQDDGVEKKTLDTPQDTEAQSQGGAERGSHDMQTPAGELVNATRS